MQLTLATIREMKKSKIKQALMASTQIINFLCVLNTLKPILCFGAPYTWEYYSIKYKE